MNMFGDKFTVTGLTPAQAAFAEKILRAYQISFEILPDNTVSFTDPNSGFLLEVFKTAVQASSDHEDKQQNKQGPWGLI